MKNLSLIASVLLGALLIQGCAGYGSYGRVDRNCPAPSKDQLNKDGLLMLQNGVTLKCQVKNNTSRLPCSGITDGKDDGWICKNGEKDAVFLFDDKGILKYHKLN